MPSKKEDKPPLSVAGIQGVGKPAAHFKYVDHSDSDLERDRTGKMLEKIIIPAREGRAFKVRSGQTFRVCCFEGPQVADLIAFNLNNPEEKFWAARTRVIHGGHLSEGDQLWSTPPCTRPMFSIVADTVDIADLPDNVLPHDLLFSAACLHMGVLIFRRRRQANNHSD